MPVSLLAVVEQTKIPPPPTPQKIIELCVLGGGTIKVEPSKKKTEVEASPMFLCHFRTNTIVPVQRVRLKMMSGTAIVYMRTGPSEWDVTQRHLLLAPMKWCQFSRHFFCNTGAAMSDNINKQ